MNEKSRLLKQAQYLAVSTVLYNIIEGVVSVWFGLHDESLALFGFGADSFVEVISAIGVFYMINRISKSSASENQQFERIALRITGYCFYALAFLLIAGSVYNIITVHKPETTFPGVVITILSILSMIILYKAKVSVGNKLQSKPIIADAKCSLVCIYMSIVVLASSILYEVFHIGWIDALGSIGLAYFSITEGREALEKAKGNQCSCDDCC
jgi:divalent metal cation (Fe/Co/Zn/Cd) transporter